MPDRKHINPRRPIPASGYDRLRDNISANFRPDPGRFNEPQGFPTESFPPPDTRPSAGRADQISRSNDTVRDLSIGLQDHDEAIMYYFNNVIKPSVIINGNRTNVPIMYGSPERWKAVQKDGYFRDKEGKIQTPLIMFKRDSVEKRRDLGNKLDGNNPQLHYTFQRQYSAKNVYDNFSILQGRKPKQEMYKVVVPDFVKLNYSCTLWCDYVAQMNKLVEMINYSSDSYWGDKERFKFNAKIDTFSHTTEINQGENRIVKTDFGLVIQGYLVPDSINQSISIGGTRKSYTKSKVRFNTEVITGVTSDASRTREEVRGEPLGISINEDIAALGGIGYQIIGNTNQIA